MCSCNNIMRVLKKEIRHTMIFSFALVVLHFNKIIWWVCIAFMRAMWRLINLYIYFATCAKGVAWVWNLIIVRKFNEGIARMIISMDWCGLSKNIKFICKIFIWDLIVELYKAIEKNFSLVVIPSIRSLQHCFW